MMRLIGIIYPVTAETTTFETKLDHDGNFYFKEIPIECNTIGFIHSDILDWTSIGVGLLPDEETQIEIIYDENNNFNVRHTKDKILSTSDTILYSYELMDKFLNQEENRFQQCCNMKPDEFLQCAMDVMDKRIAFVLDGSSLPVKAKNFISNEVKFIYLVEVLFNYTSYTSCNDSIFQAREKPDKTYYSFLRDFNLNNPQYLYTMTYPKVLEVILRNDTLSIPPIGETPVGQWMKEVKTIMADLLGFDKGLFYDLLAANSYALQFNDATRPLSNRQKENITNYFTGKKKEFAKIILNKSKEIEKIADITAHLKINETPMVSEKELTNPERNHPKGLLVDSIVARYKEKVIVIDFWNTWCGPCLEAMQTSRELKQEMLNKDVIFVYLANISSPKQLWENKIQGIGGEHYYLNGEEWESISYSDKYEFDGIPTYLVFDKNGKVRHKITGYPGNDTMRKIIEELLP
ncbi:hypothetical protein FACS1894182_10880 [Bacteroidia bacterium]|nr:hypothetical protein FACS1894182_10880 [Bacteroidia bacterium]